MSIVQKPLRTLRKHFLMARNRLTFRHKSPDALMGDLFHDVQVQRVFPDSITFVDMVPPKHLNHILKLYKDHRHDSDFDLVAFVNKHFVPPSASSQYKTNKKHTLEQHIEEVWPLLYRSQQSNQGSLIGLPNPYMVAGGRFQTAFYWDSYFIMLGLAAAGKWDMVQNMVDNFAFLLRRYGHIPNGSRTYYIGRSQPPFFALMIRLLAEDQGEQTLVKYLPALLTEYKFWMKGRDKCTKNRSAFARVVRMPGGEYLNRYYDDKSAPRPEGYLEDLTIGMQKGTPPSKQYVNLRAAAESGWDFSSRWFKDGRHLATIHTIEIVPVDLNCLLLTLEQTIAKAYTQLRQKRVARFYEALANERAAAIQKYCWSKIQGYYFDYDVARNRRTPTETLAGVFPLFTDIATNEQAAKVAAYLKERFLKKGGLVATTTVTGEQWDAPNGWPPLHWVAIRGLRRYKQNSLANTIKKRWLKTIDDSFKAEHKLVEKYDVVHPGKPAGGGEYALQDGFGWTNGVVLALLHEDALHWD